MEDVTPQERFAMWDEFLKRWPLEKLQTMTLEEYNTLGSKDCFTYWLESKTEKLGSIWGGSANKFGIFEFNPATENSEKLGSGAIKDSRYKWYKKYGATAQEAFENVRSIIISIATASQEGRISDIDEIDLGHAVKWKIAFLYQDKSSTKITCVYRQDWLQSFTNCYDKKIPTSQLYEKLSAMHTDGSDIFTYSDSIGDSIKDQYSSGKKLSLRTMPGFDAPPQDLPPCGWLIAPGHNAAQLEEFLSAGMIKIGWNEVGDLSEFPNSDELTRTLQQTCPKYSDEKSPKHATYMLWAFTNKMRIGDVVYLKKGTSKIVARGIIRSDYQKLISGQYQHARKVNWTHSGTEWECPFTAPVKTLTKLNSDKFSILEKMLVAEEAPQTEEISSASADKIPLALNTIFYGPPGTGKTYTLLETIAKRYFYEQTGFMNEAERHADAIAGLSWWEVIALCLLALGDSAKVPAIIQHPLMLEFLKNTNNKNPNCGAWSQLQIHTKDECEYVKYDFSKRSEPKCFVKDSESIWTVDRKLLTEIRPDLLERLNTFHAPNRITAIKRYQFVTFHQSYSYENFVEGLCAEVDDNGNLCYKVKSGIFQTFCQKAMNDPEHNYALFVDEINRGNVSGIFGELISLIENDKRDNLHLTLPYSGKDFCVPKNLYIIGSMNTADRSIDALDSALRRRFSFIEMEPQAELLLRQDFAPRFLNVDLCSMLTAINRRIEFLLDRDHKIGHSYFMKIQDENKNSELINLQRVFQDQIIPLLEDYFYGNLEKVRMILGSKFVVPAGKEEMLTADCLMVCDDSVEMNDKLCLKIADITKLTEADFNELIK